MSRGNLPGRFMRLWAENQSHRPDPDAERSGPVAATSRSDAVSEPVTDQVTEPVIEPGDDPAAGADCLFCKILAKEIPAEVVLETDHAVAFRDIAPVAPTHVLVIPRRHAPNVAASVAADPAIAGQLIAAAQAVAAQEAITDYRLVINTGLGAQQTVFHTHLHVIGGRDLQWPPG